MNIQKAVQRLHWRFTSNASFKANTSDLSALNDIIQYVNAEEEKTRLNQVLFAKLYVKVYQRILESNQTDVFDQKTKIDFYTDVFSPPLDQLIEEFTKGLNHSEMYYKVQEYAKVAPKHPLLRTADENAEIENGAAKLNEEMLKDPELQKILSGQAWDVETVKDCLMADITHCINTYQ